MARRVAKQVAQAELPEKYQNTRTWFFDIIDKNLLLVVEESWLILVEIVHNY